MNTYVFYINEYSFPNDNEVEEKNIAMVCGIDFMTALKYLEDFVKAHPNGRLNDGFCGIEYETEDVKLSAIIEIEED